jgi:hypothetical protein
MYASGFIDICPWRRVPRMIRKFTMIMLACTVMLPVGRAAFCCGAYTVDGLYGYCGVAESHCGAKLACEGDKVRFSGVMDWSNVFFKADYPQLPYEKFMVRDRESVRNIEVWVTPESAGEVYRILREQRNASAKGVTVKGTIRGFDMPVMGRCRRGIKIELDDPEGMEFD